MRRRYGAADPPRRRPRLQPRADPGPGGGRAQAVRAVGPGSALLGHRGAAPFGDVEVVDHEGWAERVRRSGPTSSTPC
ncbi:hypothetical protein NKH77_44305 [Streptomyces sp. M19]